MTIQLKKYFCLFHLFFCLLLLLCYHSLFHYALQFCLCYAKIPLQNNLKFRFLNMAVIRHILQWLPGCFCKHHQSLLMMFAETSKQHWRIWSLNDIFSNVPSCFCPLIWISVWMPLALFVITSVFSELLSN